MRAQTSIEFMILFGIFLAAILIMVFVVWSYVFEISSSTTDLNANTFLNRVSNKVDTAFLEGHGFSMNFTLPETILGMNYSVDIEKGFVFLNLSSRIYTKRIATKNVTGDLKTGKNILENVNGVVVIS